MFSVPECKVKLLLCTHRQNECITWTDAVKYMPHVQVHQINTYICLFDKQLNPRTNETTLFFLLPHPTKQHWTSNTSSFQTFLKHFFPPPLPKNKPIETHCHLDIFFRKKTHPTGMWRLEVRIQGDQWVFNPHIQTIYKQVITNPLIRSPLILTKHLPSLGGFSYENHDGFSLCKNTSFKHRHGGTHQVDLLRHPAVEGRGWFWKRKMGRFVWVSRVYQGFSVDNWSKKTPLTYPPRNI